jgi:m7GpppX diphosphatase
MKTASVLGSIEGQAAILIIEKTAFGENVSSITTETESPTLKLLQRNDIYRWYLASLSEESVSIKATIIYPATEVHIRKHQKQQRHMIKETPEIYRDHIEDYIQTMKGSRIQWCCIFTRLLLM